MDHGRQTSSHPLQDGGAKAGSGLGCAVWPVRQLQDRHIGPCPQAPSSRQGLPLAFKDRNIQADLPAQLAAGVTRTLNITATGGKLQVFSYDFRETP